jgi:hypothetical protein
MGTPMSYRLTEQYPLLTLTTPELELAFSCENGRLCVLKLREGPNLVGYGAAIPSLDVELGEAGAWLSARFFPRYLGHALSENDAGVILTLRVGLGALIVEDCYQLQGPLIRRRVAVTNLDDEPARLRSVLLLVPWVQAGALQHSRFDAPGNSVRPRVPLTVAAVHRRGSIPRRFLAPALRQGEMFELAPTQSAGLLAVHNSHAGQALLCWYYGEQALARPVIDGNGQGLTLGHQLQLAGWLADARWLAAGEQYLLPLRANWHEALAAPHALTALRRFPAHPPANWLAGAACYSCHPARYGGFRGTAEALPALRALGIDTLCLMPVWRYENPSGLPWDGNVQQTGNPYALLDLDELDPQLGSAQDLRALVDAAHELGMRVLLDLPLVGVASAARYVETHHGWFAHDDQGCLVAAAGWPGVVCFNWANSELHVFLRDWALATQRRFDVDGFYAGVTRAHVPAWGRDAPASAASMGVARWLADLRRELKTRSPELVVISDAQGPLYSSTLDACHDYLTHAMCYNLVLGRVSAAELGDWLADQAALWASKAPRICFTESLETNSLNPLADGLRGSRISRMLLAGLLFCGCVPLLWAEQEEDQEPFITRLLQLRREQAALREGDALFNRVSCADPGVFALLRLHGDERLLCVLNVSSARRSVELSLPWEALGLLAACYQLSELLGRRLWNGLAHAVWKREDLARLRIALEPFAAYCIALSPLALPVARDEELVAAR